jgi:polar amino acid transport system substrate-binding protein
MAFGFSFLLSRRLLVCSALPTNCMKIRYVPLLVSVAVFLFFLAARNSFAADSLPLRVGITPNAPPMMFKESGKIVGMEPDFAQALGQALARPITFVEVGWDEQIPALLDNKTDIIMSSMSITRPRQFRIAFSKPYLQIGQMALVRNEDASRYGLGFPYQPSGTIGVKKGTTGDFLVQQEFPRNKRRQFTAGAEGARALARKKVDLFIGDSPMIWWLASVNEVNNLTAVPILLSDENLGWGIRKSDHQLLDAVNSALEQMMKNGKLAQIVRRWLPNAK